MAGKRKNRRIGPPPYCDHKSSGQAYVKLDGKEHDLRKLDSLESHQKYAKVIAEHAVGAVMERAKPDAVVT